MSHRERSPLPQPPNHRLVSPQGSMQAKPLHSRCMARIGAQVRQRPHAGNQAEVAIGGRVGFASIRSHSGNSTRPQQSIAPTRQSFSREADHRTFPSSSSDQQAAFADRSIDGLASNLGFAGSPVGHPPGIDGRAPPVLRPAAGKRSSRRCPNGVARDGRR